MWTKEFPIKEGHYFLRNYLTASSRDGGFKPNKEPTTVFIYRSYPGLPLYCTFPGNPHEFEAQDFVEAEWHGPIYPPD